MTSLLPLFMYSTYVKSRNIYFGDHIETEKHTFVLPLNLYVEIQALI